MVPTPRNAPIHAEAPEFTDMSVEQEILVTGIKVVDLLAPYAKGGKIGKCLECAATSSIEDVCHTGLGNSCSSSWSQVCSVVPV